MLLLLSKSKMFIVRLPLGYQPENDRECEFLKRENSRVHTVGPLGNWIKINSSVS